MGELTLKTSTSSVIGLVSMATAIVAVIGLVFITLFYSLSGGAGDPFGAYNDICVGLGGILSGVLALILFPVHRAYAPRVSWFALSCGCIGAIVAPLGSGLVYFGYTGWFLAGLVTTFGYALIGIWFLTLNYSALHWISFPRGLARFGIVTGWVMIAGILAGPGILARTDYMDLAPWYVLTALIAGGMGWNLLYTVWCIWLGRLLLSRRFMLHVEKTA
jgi:hypothetical protein